MLCTQLCMLKFNNEASALELLGGCSLAFRPDNVSHQVVCDDLYVLLLLIIELRRWSVLRSALAFLSSLSLRLLSFCLSLLQ